MKRSARVVAMTDTALASLNGPAFLDMLRTYPSAAIRVLERLTRIVRALDNRVTTLSSQTDRQRIWAELVRLAKPEPLKTNGWHIPDMPNHREIAAWAGTTKEKVAEAIGELARDGIVRRKTMGLIISDMTRLETMTNNVQ